MDQAQKTRERPERDALRRRYASAVDWLETNGTTLDHFQRFVLHVEQMIAVFCQEEQSGEASTKGK